MSDKYSELFINGLKNNDIELLKTIPKGEFHNHSALGVSRNNFKKFGKDIDEKIYVNSIEEMNDFAKKYISVLTKTEEGFKKLIEGTIVSAIDDGITILETSIDYRFFKFFTNNLEEGICFLKDLIKKYKSKIEVRYDIGLSRKSYKTEYKDLIIKLVDSNIFSGIDLYGEEQYNELEKFIPLYKHAKSKNLKLKAHVGEFNKAKDIIETIKALNLDIVQHGISIIDSTEAIRFVKEKEIIFNICPTSNLLLKRVKKIEEHPLKKMYEAGLKVTINTDDLLLFDSTLSNEYLTLYKNNVFTAEELDKIRQESLKY